MSFQTALLFGLMKNIDQLSHFFLVNEFAPNVPVSDKDLLYADRMSQRMNRVQRYVILMSDKTGELSTHHV